MNSSNSSKNYMHILTQLIAACSLARWLHRPLLLLVLWVSLSVALYGQTSSASPGSPQTSAPVTQKDWSPGKADFQYRHTPATDEYNFIWWTSFLKGGFGVINTNRAATTKYGGFFIRPLWKLKNKGDLILGVQKLDSRTEDAWEAQGEYRFNFGLGIGGGVVRRRDPNLDVTFGKLSFRKGFNRWKYILEAQAQKVGRKTSLGGFGAIYDEQVMFTLGTDQEQWRTSIAYIAPDQKALIRPVVEVLYVDNQIGRISGPKSFFINGSLRYYGGFLSHPARLGRAMGPTGLEFGNPLGFLAPTWNRRLDVWELGDLVNFRLEHISLPNRTEVGRYELLSFPLQFENRKNTWDRFFVGASYTEERPRSSLGILGGFFGKVKLLNMDLTLKGEYFTSTHRKQLSVGLIRRF
jgi:hypothetical protein